MWVTCLSYIPKLPISSLLTMVPPLDDGSGRQIGYLFFIHWKNIYRGALGTDHQGVYSMRQDQAGTYQIITLENVNVDSLCGNCHSTWCCEGLDSPGEFTARSWRMNRSPVNSADIPGSAHVQRPHGGTVYGVLEGQK